MATTAKAFREKRQQGVLDIELPEFGDVITIRPMNTGFFIKAGGIPDFFAATLREMIDGERRTVPFPPTKEMTENMDAWLKWLDELIKYAVVTPKVVDNPQAEDEIGIDEIGYTDKLFIYQFFGQPAAVLRNFRQGQTQPLAIVEASTDDGPASQPDIADKKVGKSATRSA